MTSAQVQLLVPSIPTGRPAPARAVGRASRPLPVPPLQAQRPRTIVYGLAAVDCNGRIGDLHTVRALGWSPGLRLASCEVDGSLVFAPQEGGSVRVTDRGYLVLPVATRRRCGLVAGDRVLLVADIAGNRMVVHPPAALDTMVAARHAQLLGGGDA